MLGRELCDPHGIESKVARAPGFGLLDFVTTLEPQKRLVNVRGRLALDDAPVQGYEIHMGITEGPALASPAVMLDDGNDVRPDGAISGDGQILTNYLHGLFDAPDACRALLHWAGLADAKKIDHDARRLASIDKLADAVAHHVDIDALWRLVA